MYIGLTNVHSICTLRTLVSWSAFFQGALTDGEQTVRLRPEGGWHAGASIGVAYLVGEVDDPDKRALFVRTSMANQAHCRLCTL